MDYQALTFANLHLHSNRSDGLFRPLQLPRIAGCIGYGALALTDHETIHGLSEFRLEAERCNIDTIPGVEVFARLEGDERVYHITGLDFDPDAFRPYSERLVAYRNEDTRLKFEYARQHGFFSSVEWADVLHWNPHTDWFHAAQIRQTLDLMGIAPLQKQGTLVTDGLLLEGSNTGDLFVRPMKEVIDAIRSAGGIAVLAHPRLETLTSLKRMVDLGLNGIEISHPSIPEQAAKEATRWAREYNLYCSGGTDHTGVLSSFGGKGVCSVRCGISREDYEILKNRLLG